LLLYVLFGFTTFAQSSDKHADSAKINKQHAEEMRMAKLKAGMIYPVVKGTDKSGVIAVKDFTEATDTTMEYKLLFDLNEFNPDSLATESNIGLNEIAHKVNLHVAAGIPLRKIKFIIIVHGPALKAITNNQYYKERFKVDNPNVKIITDLAAAGGKFIACGQAMAFQGIEKAMLLPVIKVAFTAQTWLSYYQMKGYVKFDAKR
jgi:intracellular sulfur oxidation DsrE/DsrF family protein